MREMQSAIDQIKRRHFFGAGMQFGGAAFAALSGLGFGKSWAVDGTDSNAPNRVHPPLPGLPHFKPKAKSIIYLHMNGGPSQLDTWDYKPGLQEYFDKDLPPTIRGEQRLSTMTSGQGRFPVAPSKFKFEQCGKSGMWVNTELLPHTSKIVDEITLIKTVTTNAINHDPACTFVMTGSEIPGKASIGSWISYGLGSENDNLPAFVVFTPQFPSDSNGQALYNRMWGSGFLPTRYSGVALRGAGDPFYISRIRQVSERLTVGPCWTRCNSKQRGSGALCRPEIQTVSRNTKWLSACRVAFRSLLT